MAGIPQSTFPGLDLTESSLMGLAKAQTLTNDIIAYSLVDHPYHRTDMGAPNVDRVSFVLADTTKSSPVVVETLNKQQLDYMHRKLITQQRDFGNPSPQNGQ